MQLSVSAIYSRSSKFFQNTSSGCGHTKKKKQTKNLSNDFDYFNLTQSNAWMVDHARITPVQGAYSGQRVYRILKLLLSCVYIIYEWFFCAVYISCTPRYMFVLFFINKSLPVFYNTLFNSLLFYFIFFHFSISFRTKIFSLLQPELENCQFQSIGFFLVSL